MVSNHPADRLLGFNDAQLVLEAQSVPRNPPDYTTKLIQGRIDSSFHVVSDPRRQMLQ